MKFLKIGIFWGENWLEIKSVEVGVVTSTVPPSPFESANIIFETSQALYHHAPLNLQQPRSLKHHIFARTTIVTSTYKSTRIEIIATKIIFLNINIIIILTIVVIIITCWRNCSSKRRCRYPECWTLSPSLEETHQIHLLKGEQNSTL